MSNKNQTHGEEIFKIADEEVEQYVELDPTERFGRYDTLLSSDSLKKVYKAFDEDKGIEVAWHHVPLDHCSDEDPWLIDWVFSEVEMWKSLNHKNIVACYSVWKDEENKAVNFISEVCTSGNLRDFRKKYRRVSSTALKRWSKQILKGLKYLHTHDPCVIHSDLTCSNIYVNGCTSEIKIGDPSFAALIGKGCVGEASIGTSEFMAPELLNQDYTETVDIYSFGMCLLEMATLEIPYSECKNAEEIRERVSSGIKPEALSKVNDPDIKEFIMKCIAEAIDRPSASELLNDQFFHPHF